MPQGEAWRGLRLGLRRALLLLGLQLKPAPFLPPPQIPPPRLLYGLSGGLLLLLLLCSRNDFGDLLLPCVMRLAGDQLGRAVGLLLGLLMSAAADSPTPTSCTLATVVMLGTRSCGLAVLLRLLSAPLLPLLLPTLLSLLPCTLPLLLLLLSPPPPLPPL
jgi:hypothetical protein